ncbi:MAG TPA: hypothetical protein VGP47_08125, partial [Parachlamydiaceae bacterium]|nr:hypothetical protein [Parachlamydiaceae bacterium]
PTFKTPDQPPEKSQRLKSLPPQTPLGAPVPSVRGPASSSPKFESPEKQLTAPPGGDLLQPKGPTATGPFPKIRTQEGTPFEPWATLCYDSLKLSSLSLNHLALI